MGAVEQMTDSAAYRYHPPKYAGNVLLLQPLDRPERVDYLPGWRFVASERLVARDVQGHHDELLTPENVESVANAISSHIEEMKVWQLRSSVAPAGHAAALHVQEWNELRGQ